MKQLKFEDHEDELALGATMGNMKDFGINIYIPLKRLNRKVRQDYCLSYAFCYDLPHSAVLGTGVWWTGAQWTGVW